MSRRLVCFTQSLIKTSVSSGNFLIDISRNNIYPDIWHLVATTRCHVKLTFTVAGQGLLSSVPLSYHNRVTRRLLLFDVWVPGAICRKEGCESPSYSHRCPGAVDAELPPLNLTSDAIVTA